MAKNCLNEKCSQYRMAITRDKVKFCAKCGKELQEIPLCKYCEHEIYPQDKFCEMCGRSCL